MPMKKDLEYYLSLPYRIEVVPIRPEEGGGYMATLPEVGRMAITGDGETPEEAIRDLEKQQRERFAEYLAKGVRIPEPAPREEYSGRLMLRMPKSLHRDLAAQARENAVSLNQFVTYLLGKSIQKPARTKTSEGLKRSASRG
jgi:predicted HicB family RNase H-like nuclease